MPRLHQYFNCLPLGLRFFHSGGRECDVSAGSLRANAAKRARVYCLILGFATEYSTSVRKFTATYVNPMAKMQPWTK